MVQNTLFSAFIFQLLLSALAAAAPAGGEIAKTATVDNPWQYGTGGGILGLVVLILDIIVFVEVIKSSRPPASKLLWCLVVFFFPIIGMVVYWLFSNRTAHNSGDSYQPLA